MNMIDAVFT